MHELHTSPDGDAKFFVRTIVEIIKVCAGNELPVGAALGHLAHHKQPILTRIPAQHHHTPYPY